MAPTFRNFIGIDPDMHSMGVAVVTDIDGVKPYLSHVACIKAKGETGGAAVVAISREVSDYWQAIGNDVISSCVAFAVEGQEMYLGKTKNPRSIMFLAAAAGAALHELASQYPEAFARFPTPGDWKGQVPKQVHQMRAFNKLGIMALTRGTTKSGYCVPDMTGQNVSIGGTLNIGDWKHVGDAVGIALWVREQYIQSERKKELRNNRNSD